MWPFQNALKVKVMHQSIPAVPMHPPGQPRGICSRCQSRGWGIGNFIVARGLGISIPRGDPRAFDTSVFERWMTVKPLEDWLVCRGLEKLVDILKICFLNLWYFFIACKQISISDKVNYILVITKQSLTWTLREQDYFAFKSSQAIFKV